MFVGNFIEWVGRADELSDRAFKALQRKAVCSSFFFLMTRRVLKRFFWMKSRCFFFLFLFLLLWELQRHEEKREEYRRKEPCLASIQRAVSFGEGSLVSFSPCDSGISFWAFFYFHLCLFFSLRGVTPDIAQNNLCSSFFFPVRWSTALGEGGTPFRQCCSSMTAYISEAQAFHVVSESLISCLERFLFVTDIFYCCPFFFPLFSHFFSLIRRKRCWKP